jgi:hypothetical protein
MGDRDRGAAEIDAVDQNAGDRAVHDADTVRPARPRDHDDDRHQPHHAGHADREIGQRLGAVEHVFGADEAGAPQHDKDRRRRARGKFFEVAGHWAKEKASRISMAGK